MKPMLIVSKLDLNFRLFPTSTKKLCQSEGSINIFKQSQSRTYLDRAHKETDSSNQDSYVVVFSFNTVGLTLERDNFLKALIQKKLLGTCAVLNHI